MSITLSRFAETLHPAQKIPRCTKNSHSAGVKRFYSAFSWSAGYNDKILIDDGLIELEVQATKKDSIVCLIENGGELGEKKGIKCAECKN